MAGMHLRTVLPEHHLDAESKDTVKLGAGLVATMTALLLGLMIASVKTSFDSLDTALKQTAAQILALDRALARYGPETSEIRQALQQTLQARVESIWSRDSGKSDMDAMVSGAVFQPEGLAQAIRALPPHDDLQRSLQSRALDLSEAILQARWLVLAGAETSIPSLFLVILFSWLTISFLSFGLFAPRNSTVFAMLFVCALAVSSAVFLILEMDSPFEGLLRVSADPLRYAYSHMNH
jgi:hypothetical protein